MSNAQDTITQPAAAYSYRIGDIIVTAAHEGFNAMPLKDGFVRNADFADVQRAMRDEFLPMDTLNITFTPLVIRTGGETVLIDTGFADNGPPTAGFLRKNMAAAGIDPKSLTKVVISHFHGDHINGLRSKAGEELYPSAQVLVPEVEWNFWTRKENKARAPEAMKPHFENVARVFDPIRDKVATYTWDSEVAPGVTAIDASGHTPGHTAYTIASGNDRMIMISDVTNHPALFVRNPGWSPVFDMDPEKALATRKRLLEMIASEGLQIAGYHLPFPATGHLIKEANRYRLIPIQWMMVV